MKKLSAPYSSTLCLAIGLLCAILGAQASRNAADAREQTLLGGLKPGPHTVGYQLVIDKDVSRAALPDSVFADGRVVPISMWYPAHDAPRLPMRIADYASITPQALTGVAAEADGIAAFRANFGPAGDVERLLNDRGLAIRDAPAKDGRYPLVLFAHSSPEAQSIMSEYLASHGFIVAAVRSRGATEVAYRLSRANLDAMVADLRFGWSAMQTRPNVRRGPAAVVGMSNGSIAAMALQLVPGTVAGVVSLDGGIGEAAGGTYLDEKTGGEVRRLSVPVIHFFTPDNKYLDLSFLRSYRASQRTLVSAPGLRHVDFLNHAVFDDVLNHGAERAARRVAYEWVTEYTRYFLNAVLRSNASSAQWLRRSPEENGVPSGRFAIEWLPGT